MWHKFSLILIKNTTNVLDLVGFRTIIRQVLIMDGHLTMDRRGGLGLLSGAQTYLRSTFHVKDGFHSTSTDYPVAML